MTKWSFQKALYVLATALFGVTANGIAQEAGVTSSGPTLNCSGGTSCPDPSAAVQVMGAGPVIGAGPLGVVSTGGMAFAMQEKVEVVKNRPYEALAVTEVKQTLADGSHITQTTTATVARDSEGRTVRIQQLSTIGPWRSGSNASQGTQPTLTTIFDPVAESHTDYMSDNKVAHVVPIPPPLPSAGTHSGDGGFVIVSGGPAGGAQEVGGVGPMTFALNGHANTSQPTADHAAPDIRAESLGTKTVQGISVNGTRTTTTIPAGTIGNDKDLVITRETWFSPDLTLVVQSTQTDPRFGTTTYTLTNIQRSEPDPTLFQVPAGYKVEKVPVFVQPH